MNPDIAIKVYNVSKRYTIGSQKDGSLRGTIAGILGSKQVSEQEEFWALKNVSFEIKKGDVIGIIGKNGAGKSTLLKILSQITKPTSGRIEINGRVASLLEVGTGFHPELTGCENIYLNGTILGMTRQEVKEKFDEIVEFSGVRKFIDTAVKHYSSGMYVRLAFAVAAHLEPEILIIDEVLAVGDAEFQKKCLGKMKEVAGHGRTVIFVSHNMSAVKSLCTKGIVIQNGEVKFQGTQLDAAEYYFNHTKSKTIYRHQSNLESAIGNENIRVTHFEVNPRKGNLITIYSGIDFELKFYNFQENKNIDITYELMDAEENIIFHYGTVISEKSDSVKGEYKIKCSLPNQLLNTGSYRINLIFGENQRYLLLKLDDFIQFEVLPESLGSNSTKLPGIILPELEFTIQNP
jgi:lipopolysaccharide transport system ATP-binding protein